MNRCFIVLFLGVILITSCIKSENKSEKIETVQGKAKAFKKKTNKNKNLTINLYLENSGSMFGYVEPSSSRYKLAVNELYYSLKSRSDSIHISTINEQVLSAGWNRDDFIQKLSKESLDRGKPESSDISEMFLEALKKVEKDAVSILISDGIYAADDELLVQAPRLRHEFSNAIKNKNLQTIVVKLTSSFDGLYYRCCGQSSVTISQNRPYYLWLFGNSQTISDMDIVDDLRNLTGFEHIHEYSSKIANPTYSIIPYNKVGRYRRDRDADKLPSPYYNALKNAEPAKRGRWENEFHFSVGIDMSDLPVDNSYYQNPDNYQSTNQYEIKEIITREEFDPIIGADLFPFDKEDLTHIVTLAKKGFPVGEVDLKLEEKMPQWILKSHMDKDINIIDNENQTRGFRYLMQGIDKAYRQNTENQHIFKLTFYVNR